MLFSLALIFIGGLLLGGVFKKINLPSLLGMLLVGILLGPYALNLLSPNIFLISSDLRQIALIIILTRAGLALNFKDLIKVGRPAILMCFIPACLEIMGMILLAPPLLGLSITESAVLGAVIAAVSPAVIVPKMLKLMDEEYGTDKSIPQMIMAGSSVDDVFVLVLFTAFTAIAQGNSVSFNHFIIIPSSIGLGLIVGIILGIFLIYCFMKVQLQDSAKILIILSVGFIFVSIEHLFTGNIGFSGLLAVMSMGATLQKKDNILAKQMSTKFSKLWVGAEILLFVLVGATVDINYALTAGMNTLLLIMGALVFRMIGVYICMIKTSFSVKEKLFCMFAYIPKATVQAAIGSIPLAMGLNCGNIVLTVAVVAILFTAPLGAVLIDGTYKKLLTLSK